jgi:hypothetical protein
VPPAPGEGTATGTCLDGADARAGVDVAGLVRGGTDPAVRTRADATPLDDAVLLDGDAGIEVARGAGAPGADTDATAMAAAEATSSVDTRRALTGRPCPAAGRRTSTA